MCLGCSSHGPLVGECLQPQASPYTIIPRASDLTLHLSFEILNFLYLFLSHPLSLSLSLTCWMKKSKLLRWLQRPPVVQQIAAAELFWACGRDYLVLGVRVVHLFRDWLSRSWGSSRAPSLAYNGWGGEGGWSWAGRWRMCGSGRTRQIASNPASCFSSSGSSGTGRQWSPMILTTAKLGALLLELARCHK